ncbi:MAG TPA: winged helix-turn-helix domain-containing protein [Terriglobales bacterium]|nr:winged helix-turn-helix domain-containing protein [Terriglobales bacterium]
MKLTRAGHRIRLTAQALDLLVLLIERPGELVTREEIQRNLWPASSVEFEHSIDVVLNRLRKALGDNSKDPRYIQTVPRNGYRFIEAVKSEARREPVVVHRGWTRRLKTYAAVAFFAAAVTFLIVHTRYDKVVGSHVPPMSRTTQTK